MGSTLGCQVNAMGQMWMHHEPHQVNAMQLVGSSGQHMNKLLQLQW